MSEAKRVLIAEDEAADVMLMRIALRELALDEECAVVRDGQEALDYLFCQGPYAGKPGGNPELVLLDLKLPKVSGLELLRKMKAECRLNTVPVVIFSSSLDEKDKADALASGANDFMVKPMGFDAFRTAIMKIVSAYLAPD